MSVRGDAASDYFRFGICVFPFLEVDCTFVVAISTLRALQTYFECMARSVEAVEGRDLPRLASPPPTVDPTIIFVMVPPPPSLSRKPRVGFAGGSRLGGSYASRPRHAVVGLQRLVSGVPALPGTCGVMCWSFLIFLLEWIG